MSDPQVHYQRPGRLVRWILNPGMVRLSRVGVSVLGSRTLEVRGRRSGVPRRTPVNLLTVDGRQYLVSARGEGEWVRNVRADGGRLTLLLGRRRDERIATEVPCAERAQILRAYLRRWKLEVGKFFDGVDAGSSDEEIARIAAEHPVFVLSVPRG